MNINGITYPDVNNGLGCRVTLWVSGCIHHCHGCHNKETWNFNSGRKFTISDKNKLFEILSLPYIKGLTLSGGDPLCSYDEIFKLVKEVKENFPNKDIWLYSGFTLEYIQTHFGEILKHVDVLVDGKFIEELKDVSLPFRGSSNQNIWKIENGEITKILE